MLSLQNGVDGTKEKVEVEQVDEEGYNQSQSRHLQQGLRDGEHRAFVSMDGHVRGVEMGQHVHTLLAKDADQTLLLVTYTLFYPTFVLFGHLLHLVPIQQYRFLL